MKKYLHIRSILFVLLFIFTFFSTALAATTAPASPFNQQPVAWGMQENYSAVAASAAAPTQQYADIEVAKKEMADTFSSHVNLMSYGFTVLGVFTGILALVGLFITFFSIRVYQSEIKEKKANFEKYEQELKALLEVGKKHCESLSDMARKFGNKEKFDKNILEAAKNAIANGTGIEVLWGKAILSQENEDWEKAHTFWTAILENDPQNDNALFGAALACQNIFENRGNKPAELALLKEGERFLLQIPYAQKNGAVLNNLGVLRVGMARASYESHQKQNLFTRAEENYRRATECAPTDAAAWFNWGNLLSTQADDASDPTEKNRYREMAEEKYRRASECDPTYTNVWFNWGLLLFKQVGAASNPAEKARYQEMAEEKYRRATECDPTRADVWARWGILLSEQTDDASDPTEKTRYREMAEEKYCRATECEPTNATVWFNWGVLLFRQAEAASDPAEKARYLKMTEEKYRRATECDPTLSAALSNWGTLLSEQADDVSDPAAKARYRELADEKYRRATEYDPTNINGWFNWGNLLSEQADDASDPAEKARYRAMAEEKYRRATECDPTDATVWFSWGHLLFQQADGASDPAEKARCRELARNFAVL